MGNCLVSGPGVVADYDDQSSIRVITSSGAIMEFHSPITASRITSEFPGHALFPSNHLIWTPLSLHETLLPGNSYYLHPQNPNKFPYKSRGPPSFYPRHVRSRSSPAAPYPLTPYRMSVDRHGPGKRSSSAFSLPSSVSSSSLSSSVSSASSSVSASSSSGGFWKVKLVISPDQLTRILSEEGSTHDFVHNVTTVAKCGSCSTLNSSASASASSSSDEWVASSSSS